jgi:peptidoglycan hydrolase-like protein with peptidoglycan-binding domain
MKSSRFILAAAVAASLGCIHAKKVDRGDSPKDGDEKQEPQQKKDAKSPTKTAAKTEEGREKQKKDAKEARPPAEEGRPELTTSAEGLLLPDGARLIQEALADRGYLAKDHRTGKLDEETSAALRKFQADEEFARTGYPDRDTVRKLGLPIAKVFRATGEGNKNPERKQ